MTAKKPKLDALINHNVELRRELSLLNSKAKDLEEQIKENDTDIREIMEIQGITHLKTETAAISLTPRRYTNVTDWEEFWKYAHAEKAGYLVHRRISQKAMEELLDSGVEVPGVSVFEGAEFKLKPL